MPGALQGVYRMNHSISQNNFDGTFTFSSLADYIAGRPLTFTKNSGDPKLDLNQLEMGSFLQADWKTTKSLDLSLGIRYEAQTNSNDHNNFDPRVGLAYEFTKTLALRGGIGVFHERLDGGTVSQVLLLDGTRQQQYVVRFPSFPDPFLNSNGALAPLPAASIRVFAPGLVTPYIVNSSLSLEKIQNTNQSATSSRPYTITTGFDDNGDTVINDRPVGVSRNTGIGPRAFNMGLNLTKTVNLKRLENRRGPAMTFVCNIQNLFNNEQLNGFSGVMTSPFFGRANSARNPRQIEFGLRFNF